MVFEVTTCTVVGRRGKDCDGPIPEGSPVSLCTDHLFEAYLHVVSQLRARQEAGDTTIPLEELAIAAVVAPEVWMSPDPRQSVVYYVRIGDHVKIGVTTAFGSRMTALMPDEIYAMEPGGRDVETRRHRQFNRSRAPKGREYFHPTADLMDHIEELQRIGWEPEPPPLRFPGPLPQRCPSCELLAVWSNDGVTGSCQSCGASVTAEPVAVPTSGES